MGVHRFYCGCACGGRDIFRLCNVRHGGVRRAQTAAACTAVMAFPGRVDNFVRFDGDIGSKNIYYRQAGPQRKNSSVRRQFGYRRAGGVCAPRLPRSAHFEYALDAAFFTLNLRLAAFVLLVILLITVIVMTCSFFKLDKVSGILMLPYIAWLLFAGYLNLGTYILNG